MKDWYFRRQLKSSNVCVGLYTTRISDFVFHRRRCQFPNSLIVVRLGVIGIDLVGCGLRVDTTDLIVHWI